MADIPLGEVILNNCRLSFADLFKPGKPQKNDKGEMVPGKYKCNLLMEKGTEDTKKNLAKLKLANTQVKTDKWGEEKKWPKLKPEKVYLRDGDQEDWDGYEGCFYVSANNPNQPVLIDRKKDAKGKWIELTIENGGSKLLYSGCYVNAIIRVWAQDNEFGKRVNASIESVQFLRHGEAFSGGAPVDPNGKFEDIEDDEDQIGDEDDDAGNLV